MFAVSKSLLRGIVAMSLVGYAHGLFLKGSLKTHDNGTYAKTKASRSASATCTTSNLTAVFLRLTHATMDLDHHHQ